jgi:hypothetical protein
LIDWLLEHIINENRTRRSIIKKLKEMCLIVNSKVSYILDPSNAGTAFLFSLFLVKA